MLQFMVQCILLLNEGIALALEFFLPPILSLAHLPKGIRVTLSQGSGRRQGLAEEQHNTIQQANKPLNERHQKNKRVHNEAVCDMKKAKKNLLDVVTYELRKASCYQIPTNCPLLTVARHP